MALLPKPRLGAKVYFTPKSGRTKEGQCGDCHASPPTSRCVHARAPREEASNAAKTATPDQSKAGALPDNRQEHVRHHGGGRSGRLFKAARPAEADRAVAARARR